MHDTSHPYQPRTHARARPDALAYEICGTGHRVSFAQLEARANQGAHLLRGFGLGVGDHIAILMDNQPGFFEACFAADRAGLYYTTISTHLTRGEIGHILRDCGARLAIVGGRFLPDLDAPPGCRVICADAQGAQGWAGRCAGHPETPITDEAQGLDMLYSSGTTGRPKGIKWPLTGGRPGARTMLIDLLTRLFGYDAQTRYLCPAPLYHAAPLRHSMVTLRMGGSVHVMPRFDALDALHLIASRRITHSQWVPTMFVRLLRLPAADRAGVDLGSMQVALHAAAPCPVDIKRQMIDWWGPILHEYYAGTENNGFTAITTGEWLAHPGSVGRAKLGVLHICDADGTELPPGAEGEVYFESGHPFAYHNDPEKTAACTNAMGWTTLGDIGRLDAEGYLYLTDRKSFMIITGGVNVYPQEVEDVLLGHPAVLDAAVIGVPDPDFGEAVTAVVQLVAGVPPDPALEAELIAFCRRHLSGIKCPRRVAFRAELPRTATGKLFKRLLRDEFAGLARGTGQP